MRKEVLIMRPEWKFTSCQSKKSYDDEGHAIDAGGWSMFNTYNETQLYYYQCRWCERFHITKHPRTADGQVNILIPIKQSRTRTA